MPTQGDVLSWPLRLRSWYKAFVSVFESIFDALNQGGVRYVVVGGVATLLHGYARLTVDLDLVVDLSPSEAEKAIAVLTAIGLAPRAPVDAREFADPAKRDAWMRERNMRVFTMIDPNNPLRQVDLFVESPIRFDDLWNRAETIHLESTDVRVASIPDLVEMKRRAGRPQDLVDIEALGAILSRKRP